MKQSPSPTIRTIDSALSVRAIDKDSRTATFTAATEGGVMTYYGREYLRMNGVRLERFRRNPVVLDTHNRRSSEDIIGKATVTVEENTLVSEVTFASTERAEKVWQLVQDGFLRAVSVGFLPNPKKTIQLLDGETDGEGKHAILGPARIINEWELFEISVVPVPADPDALRRAYEDSIEKTEGSGMEPKEKKEQAAPEATATEAVRSNELEQERAARVAQATSSHIRAICPRGCEAEAEQCIAEGKSVEEARAIMLEVYAKKNKPVGTPEPKDEPQAREEEQLKFKSIFADDDLLRRTFSGVSEG